MTASLNQDFVTYSGDSVSPVFTVRDQNGEIVNISSVSDIRWNARRTETDTIALSKSKAGGNITFVTDGTDGMFQVNLVAVDTTALRGFYLHEAQIVDALGDVTTVTIGRMQVGITPTWSYDATQIATSVLFQTRRLIGDVLDGDQLMLDAEILWSISQYSNIMLAAADCCRNIAAQFARKVDTVQGELRTTYSQQARNYAARAVDLESRGLDRAGTPYAGGISIADKTDQVQNTDRVPPQFNLMMHDDLLPVGPSGQQTPTPSAPDAPGTL